MDENRMGSLNINIPEYNDKIDNSRLSEDDKEQKAKLMKLIINTKDEEMKLKLQGDYYRNVGIHDEWRQIALGANKDSYFSYQGNAARDFIYRFNKCGILSDQVGMGKTIEAGIIISELAYRKELKSLIILVPNENMAEKWEVELARKFGFRNFYKNIEINDGNSVKEISYDELPKVASVKSLADLYALVFSAYEDEYVPRGTGLDDKIKEEAKRAYDTIVTKARINDIRNTIKGITNRISSIKSKEFKMEILKLVFKPLIEELVGAICKNINRQQEARKYEMPLNGNYYHIVDMYLDTDLEETMTENAIINRLIDKDIICNSIVYEFNFIRAGEGKRVIDSINNESKKAVEDNARLSYIDKFRRIAKRIRQTYAVLIVSKVVTEGNDEQFNLLNYCLNADFEAESTKHCSTSSLIEKGYYFIDLLIDMGYRTLIVDEAHDYIKVSHKKKMSDQIASYTDYNERQRAGIEFADLDLDRESSKKPYYVFPLYNDYYFVEKDCLYLKVKSLAERSYRKIFMTATPIKSDMIDFYLLYLLADNANTAEINIIREGLSEDKKSRLASIILQRMSQNQKRAMNYFTHEDVIIRYIYEYYNRNKDQIDGKTFNDKINKIVDDIINRKMLDQDALNEICINKVRIQFQNTFTIKDKNGNNSEIHSISELVSSDEGIEQWQNMYSQIGIRSTRHQTFRLDSEHLELINENRRDKYKNLPIWSRRNGTIVYVHKEDNYFDIIVKRMLDEKNASRVNDTELEAKQLRLDTITNPYNNELSMLEAERKEAIDEINSENSIQSAKEMKINEANKLFERSQEKLQRKYAPKETALKIYQYINDQLTGTLHMADYYSRDVDYDDFKLHMVAKLMTDGLEIQGEKEKKRISGKVLLFADDKTQRKVLDWLQNDADPKRHKESELLTYKQSFKHEPIWYYNSLRADEEERWVITTDIKALKEKKGNYLIVVEPNKYEEGVDLQDSNTLINFDIKFCPLKMEQRIGRIDRVKLVETQPQLDIISFTPLNDMSGFMVDFLVNDLKMFSCWRGDTTGIVSMPLGDRPNSATFESAILAINEAYKSLYNFNSAEFGTNLNNLVDLGKNFTNEHFKAIEELAMDKSKIKSDFDYLKEATPNVNDIVSNTQATDDKDGDQKYILYGEFLKMAERKAIRDHIMRSDALSNHKNSIPKLKGAIKEYYETNIEKLESKLKDLRSGVGDRKGSGSRRGEINTNSSAAEREYDEISDLLEELIAQYDEYKKSELFETNNNDISLDKAMVDGVVAPILERYENTIKYYLNALLELFDSFCSEVRERSNKMTKFISYLTIEEFKVMAKNYE